MHFSAKIDGSWQHEIGSVKKKKVYDIVVHSVTHIRMCRSCESQNKRGNNLENRGILTEKTNQQNHLKKRSTWPN
jgi:hypothetical protein